MNSQKFSLNLIRWFDKNKRDLPWRKIADPYKILVSEIMLQQTTVATVIPYYKRWIKRFPTVKNLAAAKPKTVLKMWQGLGYYARARNLHQTSKFLVKNFDAKIPATRQELQTLPGLGPYTTGAVLSIAFGQREVIIDANVRRVIMRILALSGFADTTQDKSIKEFLNRVMPVHHMSSFNQGLMELGALICRSGQVLCLQCPIQGFCKAYKKGTQEIIPRVKEKQLEKKDVAVAIIRKGNKIFIQKRPSKGLLADLWEFPGGQREKGESVKQALCRELREELNVSVVSAKPFVRVKHLYTKFSVDLYAFYCNVTPIPKENRTQKWVTLSEFQKYPVPSGTVRIIDRLTRIFE